MKLKYKKSWETKKTICMDDIEIKKSNYRYIGTTQMDEKFVWVMKDGPKISFLDPETLAPVRKDINLKGVLDVACTQLVEVEGQTFLTGYAREKARDHDHRLLMFNLTTEDYHIHEYDPEGERDYSVVQAVQAVPIDGQPHVLVVLAGSRVDRWNLLTRECITCRAEYKGYFHLYNHDIVVLDDVAIHRFETPKNGNWAGILDLKTMRHTLEPLSEIAFTKGEYLYFQDRWHTVYRDEENRDFVVEDTLTHREIRRRSIPGRASFVVRGEHPKLVAFDGTPAENGCVYDLTDFEKPPALFSVPTGVKFSAEHYKLARFENQDVVVGVRSGKLWSIDTLSLMEGTAPSPQRELDGVTPLQLPDGRNIFLTKSGTFWNPRGRSVGAPTVTHAVAATVDGDQCFITIDSEQQLTLCRADSGQELARTTLSVAVRTVTTLEQNGKQQLAVSDRSNQVVFYSLPELEIAQTIADVPSFYAPCFVELDGRTHMLADREAQSIGSWDAETGEPLQQPMKIVRCAEGKRQPLNGGLDLTPQLIHIDGRPVLAISMFGLDEVLFWDVQKGEHLGELVYDKTIENNVDEHTFTYEVSHMRSTALAGQQVLVTGTHNGIVACFDLHTKQRVGKLIKTGFTPLDAIDVLEIAGTPFVVALGDGKVKILDIQAAKSVKTFELEQDIDCYAICGHKLIIFSGAERFAVELSAGE